MILHEQDIDKLIAYYEQNEEAYYKDYEVFFKNHPAITGFLLQDSNEILQEHEKDFFWYIVFILLKSYEHKSIKFAQIDGKALNQSEERQWALFEEQKGNFYEKASIFYENTDEEDALAYVEDMIQVDDESELTKVGRDVIWIATNSILDQLS